MLLQLVIEVIAVDGEYRVGHVFDHAFDNAGFDHPYYRDVCGHAGEVELIDACADRLWVVADHAVANFDGDLDDYQRMVLSVRAEPARTSRPPKGRPAPEALDATVELP